MGPPGGHMFRRGLFRENMKWPRPGGHMFYVGLYRENVKKSSCLKPQSWEPWYLEEVRSCYALKDYTTEETCLIAPYQMVKTLPSTEQDWCT